VSDVARAAGTSTAVVSYVVNDGPRNVAPDTRARVLAAIESLGYVKNRAAAALRGSRLQVVGLIVPDAATAFFGTLRRAIEQECFERDLLLITASSAFDAEREIATAARLRSLPVDALIVVSGRDEEVAVDFHGPVAYLHRGPIEATVTLDNRAAGRIAATHVLERGHRRLLLLAGRQSGPLADRELGWEDAVAGSGARASVVRTTRDRHEVIRVARNALASSAKVTAVLCATDEQALGVMSALASLGRPAPEVSVVGIDGIPDGETAFPVLTSVTTPFTEMARRVMQTVADGGDGGSCTFAPSMRVGGTVRDRQGPAE
jgi:LacI family transcriptional regulator